MEFFDLIKARYSVRKYKPDQIDENDLLRVLEAARLAPTASNRQPFRLIVIRTAGNELNLSRIYRKEWFIQAPVIICACGIPGRSWVRMDGKRYVDIDVAIAMDHLILAATNLGLGTCWVAAFNVEEARKFLELPEGIEPLVFTPLGYPADQPEPKVRIPLEELIRYDRWS